MCWAKRNKRSSGFSLIEIMIVVVIIGILAGAVSLGTRHYMDKAKHNRSRADIATYLTALSAFYADQGRYPSSEEGLVSLAPRYIDKIRPDPWNHAYIYLNPGRNSAFEIISYGSDGREGGDGAAADISSETLEKEVVTK